MSTGRLFQAFGAATENARSDETSLDRGTTRSCLPAERREARLETLATDVTNSVKYDGAYFHIFILTISYGAFECLMKF